MEAILLTCGEFGCPSIVDGRPTSDRILDELLAVVDRVTVCGPSPIPGADFIPVESGCYLSAIAAYRPLGFRVFVVTADRIAFDRSVLCDLASRLASAEAAIPDEQGNLDPLCALYRRSAFDFARQVIGIGESRLSRWIEGLEYVSVPVDSLSKPEAVTQKAPTL